MQEINNLNDRLMNRMDLTSSYLLKCADDNNVNISEIDYSPTCLSTLVGDLPITNYLSQHDKPNGAVIENYSSILPNSNVASEKANLLKMYMTQASSPSNSYFQNSISKTKICCHNLRGQCSRGEQCSFAHSIEELRSRPNLYKTRLCINYVKIGKCLKGELCRFAHGNNELRKYEERESSISPSFNESFAFNDQKSSDFQNEMFESLRRNAQQNLLCVKNLDNSSNLSPSDDTVQTLREPEKFQDDENYWQLKFVPKDNVFDQHSKVLFNCEWRQKQQDVSKTTNNPLLMPFSLAKSTDEYSKSGAKCKNQENNNFSSKFLNESPTTSLSKNLFFEESLNHLGTRSNNVVQQKTYQQNHSVLSSPLLNRLNFFQEKHVNSLDLHSLFLPFPDVTSNVSSETRSSYATGISDFSSVRSLATTQHDITPLFNKEILHKKSVDSTASGTTVPSTVNHNTTLVERQLKQNESDTGSAKYQSPLAVKTKKNLLATGCENTLAETLSLTPQLEEQQAMQLLLSIYDNI